MTLEKNKREGNILKKFSFIFVILGAVLAHLAIKYIGVGDYYEYPILITIWVFVAVYILGLLLSLFSNNAKWDEMSKNSEPHVIRINNRTAKENEEYLLKNGKKAIACVEDVIVRSGPNLPSKRTIIKFSYLDGRGTKIVKVKLYFLADSIDTIPKFGDNIEIFYENDNPENSMISCESLSKSPWYKLQKKYKFKIINNH